MQGGKSFNNSDSMSYNAPAAWRSGGLGAPQPELSKAVKGRGSTADSAPTAIAPNRLLHAVRMVCSLSFNSAFSHHKL